MFAYHPTMYYTAFEGRINGFTLKNEIIQRKGHEAILLGDQYRGCDHTAKRLEKITVLAGIKIGTLEMFRVWAVVPIGKHIKKLQRQTVSSYKDNGIC